MPAPQRIARIAVPGPLHETFDYRLPGNGPEPMVGARVRVPFGRRRVVGVVTALADRPRIADHRLRPVEELLDPEEPLFPPDLYALLTWASTYYHHPLGECFATAMPVLLRQGRRAKPASTAVWRLTEAGRTVDANDLARRAPRQAAVLVRLRQTGRVTAAHFPDWEGDWRSALDRLVRRGWAEADEEPAYGLLPGRGEPSPPDLNPEQAEAADTIRAATGTFRPFLLDGVTGSGKTEVYLAAIEEVVAAGRQALVLVPEIGLTPQLVDRFARRLDAPIAVLHSGLSDGERLGAWLAARSGEAAMVIGTRSAVFTPLARPGIIVVDEEHDSSFKQQDGFRYSARDLAVARASRLGIPAVLGSATPSLETLHNARQDRYRHLRLPRRAGGAELPRFRLLDVRGKPMNDGISAPLVERIHEHLERGGQALLFLNRRGYAPTLLCHECGWIAECERCDARLTYHQGLRRLRCHHCEHERPVDSHCPACGSVDLRPLGLGTERVEAALQAAFPDTGMVRIDRDSTRTKGAFEARMDAARSGEARILLGTQMLAKGHHLPDVTVVGVLDADQGLFGADFRAPERLAQIVIQVAGRAGRAERPGEVLIQTHHPEHPLLQVLVHEGYHRFAEDALEERDSAGLPPFRHHALIRAEAVSAAQPTAFLRAARETAEPLAGDRVSLLGPVPAPMERRAGRYRAQLLLQAARRRDLHGLLQSWVPRLSSLTEARRVRWSVDVDPLEML